MKRSTIILGLLALLLLLVIGGGVSTLMQRSAGPGEVTGEVTGETITGEVTGVTTVSADQAATGTAIVQTLMAMDATDFALLPTAVITCHPNMSGVPTCDPETIQK
jgi:hypothetical protein